MIQDWLAMSYALLFGTTDSIHKRCHVRFGGFWPWRRPTGIRNWRHGPSTLRDWAHRFNEEGPEGLKHRAGDFEQRVVGDRRSGGGRRGSLAADRSQTGDRFGVTYSERGISDLLAALSFTSAPGRAPQDRTERVIEAFKKTSPAAGGCSQGHAGATNFACPPISARGRSGRVRGLPGSTSARIGSRTASSKITTPSEAGCQAWNKLIDQPETIMSIGSIINAVGIRS